MKLYLIDLFERFKRATITKKLLFLFIFLIQVFLLVISLVKVNVEITTPGTLNNPVQNITIEDSNDRGYIASVSIFSYSKVSLIQYWLSKNNYKFNVDEINESYYLNEKDELTQGKIMKDNSTTLALINAYKYASFKDSSITIDLDSLYLGESVISIYSFAKTTLQYNDLIIKVNGESFNNYQEMLELVTKFNEKVLRFTVIRDEKESVETAELVNHDGKSSYGFGVDACYKVPVTNPKYEIEYSYKVIGPSAGAITALAIYNMLVNEDITKGYKITGTGTIDFDGNIGAIGGIEQKILTAKLYGVDIFFVDSGDYIDAQDAYNKYECDFKLVSVSNFSEMINYLDNLEVKNGN